MNTIKERRRLHALRVAHTGCMFNYDDIWRTCYSSCFHCCKPICNGDISEWIDGGETALCPHCGIDAVLPGEYPDDFLAEMRAHYFDGPAVPPGDDRNA